MVLAGADMFRLSFSHGHYEDLGRAIESIRRAATTAQRPLPILQDLQGLRVRVSRTANMEPRTLVEEERVRLTPNPSATDDDELGISYDRIAELVAPGDTVLIGDDFVRLMVKEVRDAEVFCKVVTGGVVRQTSGVTFSDKAAPFELTGKDFEDLRFGVGHGLDMVVVPGIRTAQDVLELKEMLHGLDMTMPVLAKLENAMAVSNVHQIAKAADGVVFAREDLSVALGALGALVAQKRVAEEVRALGKPMMMAYAVLESMMVNQSPTLLETSALFQSISDGYSALVLSGETSVGIDPVRAVREAVATVAEAEQLLGEAVGFHSCFISYSSEDEDFARRLRTDLTDRGVQCWFAPEDMKIGDKIRERIRRSILSYDRLLLILSAASVSSKWVETEVETALAKEDGSGPVLFPVRLDEAVLDTDTAWAAEIKDTRHIGDFRRWKEHEAYQRALARLLRDLKDSAK